MKELNEAGAEIDVLPLRVLFDLLETSEVKLSRKPKMKFDEDGAHVEIPAPGTAPEEPEKEPEEDGEAPAETANAPAKNVPAEIS